jgi:hypothetical protein
MSMVGQAVVAPSARVVSWIASIMGAAGLVLAVFPPGYGPAWIPPLALALPPMAFVLMLGAPEAFGVTSRRSGQRSVNILPAVSTIGLVVAAMQIGVLNWRIALLPAALCAGVTLLLGLGLVGRRLPGNFWVGALFWAAFGGAYGYGGLIYADVRFDREPTQSFQAQVDRVYLSYGRHSTTPHLVLAPWGPAAGETDVPVTHAAYAALGPGQTACVTLHPGALRMPWFQADVCGQP